MSIMEFRKVLTKNQVTLPKSMVDDLGIKVGDQVVFQKVDGGSYLISKVDENKLKSILMVDPVEKYGVD